jgi:RND superfamily putative drug exporter
MSPVTDPSPLRRLGRWCFRRRWVVLLGWLAFIVGANVLGGSMGTAYSQSFGDFESEATDGFRLVEQGLGAPIGENQGRIVFTAEQGVTDPAVQTAMTALLASVEAMDEGGDVRVTSPYAEGSFQIAFQGDLAGKLAFADVDLPSGVEWSEGQEYAERIREELPAIDGLEIYLGGQIFSEFSAPESEVLGLGFAIVILIVAFGSVLAMGLPIGVALGGIGAGMALVGVVSNFMTMPDFTSIIAVMIGLGVGIDYALFIVTRFREDLHKGMDPEECAGHAIDTAGRAVLFAGTTVVISVLGMLVMGLGFIQGLGVGSALTVVIVMAASVTLLPALLGFAGDRLEVTRRRGVIAAGLVAVAMVGTGLGVPAAVNLALFGAAAAVLVVGSFVPALKQTLPPRKQKAPRETVWYRYSRLVQRHSWAGAIGGLALLAILAIPVFGIRLGFSDEGNYPEETDTRIAYDLVSEGFGPGFNSPLVFVTAVPPGTDPAALDAVTAALNSTDGLLGAQQRLSPDGTVAMWFAVSDTSPQSAATEDVVNGLRDSLDEVTAGTGLDVLVSGFTAIAIDFSNYLGGRYVLFFAVVLGLSFLLLMAVFRSIFVPLKAVIVNLLSVGAAWGVVVAVFQWGWGSSLTDLTTGAPIEPFLPMMLFAIVFGLSMDYEVFLLSRMKEEYDRTGDNAEAVADGLAVTARVITAAALIMVTVFGSFLLEEDRSVKLFGTGLAVAVLLDATIVRMLLVPSTMELMGRWNWWLPRWLDRILPVIHVEGAPEDLGHDDVVDDGEGDRELVGV